MNRFRALNRILLIIINGLLIIIPFVTVLPWLLINTYDSFGLAYTTDGGFIFESFIKFLPLDLRDLPQINWTLTSRTMALLASTIAILPFFLSLIFLKKIFKNYGEGYIFTDENSILYRRLGVLLFVDALLAKPISKMLDVLIAGAFNSTNPSYSLHLEFGTPNLPNIFYGIIIIVISWVMLEASKINEEINYTV